DRAHRSRGRGADRRAPAAGHTSRRKCMSAQIIDGKAVAERVRNRVGEATRALKARHGAAPGLAVVLVGEDPASKVYVRYKVEQTEAAGMRSIEHRLPADSSEDAVVELVSRLNADPDVDGILVQLPLPKHLSSDRV